MHLCRDKTKEQLVKNIKITNTELSREEIEEKIDSGDTTIFTSILQVTFSPSLSLSIYLSPVNTELTWEHIEENISSP